MWDGNGSLLLVGPLMQCLCLGPMISEHIRCGDLRVDVDVQCLPMLCLIAQTGRKDPPFNNAFRAK